MGDSLLKMLERLISFNLAKGHSFFLWGQRQVGKSSLLKQRYPKTHSIDLLKSEEFAKYTRDPSQLRSELDHAKPKSHVIIDEVQKVPALLDEVHWLIENSGIKFILCGSSARKLKRGHANLLGGRALRFELFGFVSAELKQDFDLNKILNYGYLPPHYLSEIPVEKLRAYVADYLKEEVAAEGLVRSLPTFARFLDLAALGDTELVSYSTFGRDCGVSPNTIQEYYQILCDTLIGNYLPPYSGKVKRRTARAPKFYFKDVGVVNQLAKRGQIQAGSFNFGKAFENWVFHELNAYNHYSRKFADITYWRPSENAEVDFVIDRMEIAIEAKSTDRITSDHLIGLRRVKQDFSKIKKRIVICREAKPRITEDGIEILPWNSFTTQLWGGNLF